MKIYSIIVLLILAINSVEAFEYQEQTLQPLTHSDTQSQRLFAPKKKTYPFLEQLESLLYPSKNFRAEQPGQRLERLELAVFGNKQSGSISNRLNNLQTELENWQIGNMKAIKTQELNAEHSKLNEEKERISYQHYNSPQIIQRSALSAQQPAPKDYDYMNYRMATPLVQNIGRRAIDAIFK